MRSSLLALAMLGSLGASGAVSAATRLMIDGQPGGDVRDFDGGDARAAIVSTPLADGTVDKHIGAVTYAPLSIHVPLPLSKPMFAWIGKLVSGDLPSVTLQLIDVPADGTPPTATEYAGAVLIEAQLPVLDSDNPATGDLSLIVQVGQAKSTRPASRITSALTTANGGFRLTIAGLDARGVERIEPMTFRRTQPKSALEVSNLVVTLTEVTSASWRTWFNDFVINATTKDEKSGSLLFSESNSGTVVGQIDFSHLGIVRLSKVSGSAAYQAEMYFEKASTASSTTTGTSAAAKADALAAAGPAPAVRDAAGGKIATIAGAEASIATADAAASRTALTGVVTTTPANAAATIANSADAGTRDPAQFPRVSGLTRVAYSGTFQSGYTSEDASYTATESFSSLVQRVEAAAKAAGWTTGTLEEGTSANGRTTHESWTKGGASASTDFAEQTDGSIRLGLQVYVTLGQ